MSDKNLKIKFDVPDGIRKFSSIKPKSCFAIYYQETNIYTKEPWGAKQLGEYIYFKTTDKDIFVNLITGSLCHACDYVDNDGDFDCKYLEATLNIETIL